jgi:hypothetical protein
VRTARLFGSASAAVPGFFLYFFLGFFFRVIRAVPGFFLKFFLGFIFSATCAVRGSASAAGCWFFYGFFDATCVFLVRASSTAGCGVARYGQATRADQPGNAQPGKEFFQFPAFHDVPPC